MRYTLIFAPFSDAAACDDAHDGAGGVKM